MAIKLAKGVATVPASVIDGKLSLNLLGHHWDIEVPIKQEYPMQLQDYESGAVFGFFINDKTILVIRRDGTASVLNRSNNALYKNFVVEIPEVLLSMDINNGGMAKYDKTTKGTLITTGVIKDLSLGIATLDTTNYSVVFDTRQNYEYVTDMCIQQGVGYPVLFWQNHELVRRENNDDAQSKVLYKVTGETIVHQSTTILR